MFQRFSSCIECDSSPFDAVATLNVQTRHTNPFAFCSELITVVMVAPLHLPSLRDDATYVFLRRT